VRNIPRYPQDNGSAGPKTKTNCSTLFNYTQVIVRIQKNWILYKVAQQWLENMRENITKFINVLPAKW
jgi:hypothetical protein